MISLNTLLCHERVEPKTVKLVRHQDSRFPNSPTPYQLWLAADGRFDIYQKVQGRPVYRDARMIASFVGTPLNETLFVGLYAIKGIGAAPDGLIDPVSGEVVGGKNFYDLELLPLLADYRGRLIVAWGKGYRAWVQRAALREKTVLEIRREIGDPPFPGFLNFCEPLNTLARVPVTWRVALSAVGGIYLLTCRKKGTQYVGSAYGPGGFWARWEDYVASGHGGNRRMRDIPAADYQVTVLEVAASSNSVDQIVAMENRWKQKLLTRQFGLNGN